MPAISAVLITKNEERNIARCLESLAPVVDEIIVVDSGSTDSTEAICHRFGAKFTPHTWEGYSQQKNFANSLVSHPSVSTPTKPSPPPSPNPSYHSKINPSSTLPTASTASPTSAATGFTTAVGTPMPKCAFGLQAPPTGKATSTKNSSSTPPSPSSHSKATSFTTPTTLSTTLPSASPATIVSPPQRLTPKAAAPPSLPSCSNPFGPSSTTTSSAA